MLTATLAPGASDSLTTNPVSPAGWGPFSQKKTQLPGALVFFIMPLLVNPL